MGFPDGGYTSIVLPANPIYTTPSILSDVRFAVNSISSFAANIGDGSYHSVFASFNAATFTASEVVINSGIINVGGQHPTGALSSPPPGSDGLAITLIRDISCEVEAVLLVIDEDSIDNGNPPNFFSDVEVNDDIADIGLRTQLPFFATNADVGETITLHTGEVGDEGWFALKTIPESWDNAGPTADGLRNFVGLPSLPSPHDVGEGLGAGDDPEAFLDKIPDVTPLRATGLKALEGKRVRAVVFDSDISINYDPLDGSLKGANLGTVAFEVVDVRARTDGSSSSLPEVDIEILDAECVCEGELDLFLDAPEPISSSGHGICGLGFELAILLPPLMCLRSRRRRRSP